MTKYSAFLLLIRNNCKVLFHNKFTKMSIDKFIIDINKIRTVNSNVYWQKIRVIYPLSGEMLYKIKNC